MAKENSCSQIRIITRITAIACLISMLLCYKLWLNDRTFPVVPLLHFLPALHHPFDYILPGIAAVLLLCIAIVRNPQRFIILFLVSAVLLMLLDQNRWQPWFYQYVLMFFIMAFFNYRCDDTKQQAAIVFTFKLMIAAIYFWSGLQKLNPNFLSDTFPWLMQPITDHLGPNSILHFRFLGYSFPLIETATGICLLIPALQKQAVIAAILMHVFVLVILSPLGHNYNPVVWPWNVAMILFVLLLFYNDSTYTFADIRSTLHYNSSKFVLVLFLCMPLFNFFNAWDSYLSHNLYSGNTSGGVIFITDVVKEKLPAYIKTYAIPEEGQSEINIKYWCMKELGVPAYPEKRNFEAVKNSLFAYTNDTSQIYLLYTPKLKAGEKVKQ
ncbi:MAG: hypothetical protein JWP12_273 [Bacteroidetes bacterium]|nr:hypothetical protein [Bacteroidota bacterium]